LRHDVYPAHAHPCRLTKRGFRNRSPDLLALDQKPQANTTELKVSKLSDIDAAFLGFATVPLRNLAIMQLLKRGKNIEIPGISLYKEKTLCRQTDIDRRNMERSP
jgi:hypothetical protein